MRRLLVFLALVLVGCSEADAVRVGDRDFRIDGPPVPGGSEAPNRRLASQLCPGGYRVLSVESHKGNLDRALNSPDETGLTQTRWVIRCL
jgi:hypothetical protein